MFVTVTANVHTDTTGIATQVPCILTPSGILEPLLDYLLYRGHDRSLMWMSKVCRAVRMFLEYVQVNLMQRDTHVLFQYFAQRLYTGTFDRISGLDPSRLCWSSRSPQDASQIITHLSDFFDWLGEIRPAAAAINPRYAGAAYDRAVDDLAYQYRRNRAFLGHTWAVNATSGTNSYRVRSRRLPHVINDTPPAFPQERFEELLVKGFNSGRRPDYRGVLITLLLHGAGFRESEPFHLYVSDVISDPAAPQRAKVLIHHPSHGYAPVDWRDGRSRKVNRADYLAQQFGLLPRTGLMDSRHAGWKGGTHDAPYYKLAYWFVPEYGEWFLQIWHRYLEQVAGVDRGHPFAFINLHREPRGGMYCLAQFNKAHAKACERIGLQVSKAMGTTPHGHRHAYALALKNAGIDKALIQRFMHHSSIESQDVYTQPTIREAVAALEAAATRLLTPGRHS
jgi:hypothetical protein